MMAIKKKKKASAWNTKFFSIIFSILRNTKTTYRYLFKEVHISLSPALTEICSEKGDVYPKKQEGYLKNLYTHYKKYTNKNKRSVLLSDCVTVSCKCLDSELWKHKMFSNAVYSKFEFSASMSRKKMPNLNFFSRMVF